MDLRDLYQEMILDHNRNPRNFRKPEDANRSAEGYNPLCGDHYTIYMKTDGGQIDDLAFQGKGCAISKASASVMSSMLKGKSAVEADELFDRFRAMVTGEASAADQEALGKLAVFGGVAEHPSRVKCAILAWHAMRSALHGENEPVSTE
jgi:nitrogen fixation protein NifU and related proteins